MECKKCKHWLLCDTGFPYSHPDRFYFCNLLFDKRNKVYDNAERQTLCGGKFFDKRKPTDPKSIDDLCTPVELPETQKMVPFQIIKRK